ncbi:hypothetical protein ADIS_4851 [Lunatimonas lonarensis]|uniref:Uncharacterized protein n=1 Tax=Lunatimonas lonarensis TaxID=1232681 RepID=R7ZKX2_9BACT|nr:hypothetical protein ADIS_4851 [Lunatimonas lonarensis]
MGARPLRIGSFGSEASWPNAIFQLKNKESIGRKIDLSKT